MIVTETTTEKERRYGIGFRSKRDESALTDVEHVEVREKKETDRPIRVTPRDLTVHKVEKDTKNEVEVKNATGVSLKSKIMLGVYMLVALVLSVIVAISGIALGQNATTISNLDGKIDALTVSINAQTVEMNTLSSESAVLDKATTMGMSESTQANSVTLIPMAEETVYTANTNFFDQLCDWLETLIGG